MFTLIWLKKNPLNFPVFTILVPYDMTLNIKLYCFCFLYCLFLSAPAQIQLQIGDTIY